MILVEMPLAQELTAQAVQFQECSLTFSSLFLGRGGKMTLWCRGFCIIHRMRPLNLLFYCQDLLYSINIILHADFERIEWGEPRDGEGL